MKTPTEEITKAALALPPSERAALADLLFESLDERDEEADLAWEAEVAERLRQVDAGEVKLITWGDARGRIVG
jgi:putative addiction module component (TIGR02574 family)